jgi:acetolactate synthase-1/2/3 large subunit
MNVQEMETAKRCNANITIMIWEDNACGLIARKQFNQFGKHTDLSFGNPDFVALAHAFGWNGYRCEDSAKPHGPLEASFETEGPSRRLGCDHAAKNLLCSRERDPASTVPLSYRAS